MVWAGLSTGAVYVIAALGYNMIYLSTGVFNFAHAQLVAIGVFVAWWGQTTLKLPIALIILLCAAVGAVVSIAIDLLAVQPLRRRRGGNGQELVTTLGAAVIISGVVLLIWGSDPRAVTLMSSKPLKVFGGAVLAADLVLIAVSTVAAVALHEVTNRTMWGLASLASSEDREAAMLTGVNVKRLSLITFGLAGAFAAGSGIIIAPKTFAVFNLGDVLALTAFVAIAIGGFGSHLGVLVGGMVTGLVQSVAAFYIGPLYSTLAVFVVLLGVLLVRPQGIFGARNERRI